MNHHTNEKHGRRKHRKIYLDSFFLLAAVLLAGIAIGYLICFTTRSASAVEAYQIVVDPAPAEAPETPAYTGEPLTPEDPSEPPTEPEALPAPVSLGEFIVTAYCACEKCCGKSPEDPWYGITATGTKAAEGRTVAVDPEVIPLGTVIYFQGSDGLETGFVAEDTGGGISGNRIDMFFDGHQEALDWGVQSREVWIMEGEGK